jgi:hypothetical protein
MRAFRAGDDIQDEFNRDYQIHNEVDVTGIFDDALLTADEIIAFGSGGDNVLVSGQVEFNLKMVNGAGEQCRSLYLGKNSSTAYRRLRKQLAVWWC